MLDENDQNGRQNLARCDNTLVTDIYELTS